MLRFDINNEFIISEKNGFLNSFFFYWISIYKYQWLKGYFYNVI